MMSEAAKGYEFFEHTADAGIRVYGASLAELFTFAAQGMVALLVEDSVIAQTEMRALAVSAPSVEELLRRWLMEVLFVFHTERFVPAAYRIEAISPTELRAQLAGERFDPPRHMQGTEVKGVTYHQLQVCETDHGWEAQVIFDV